MADKDGNLGSVAVIGAGISGLTAAYKLQKEGIKVSLFESEQSPGGIIHSYSKDGFIWDRGANTMVSNAPMVNEIIEDLNLTERKIFPRESKVRFIVRNGEPQKVPTSPIEFITTKLLSTKAKLRILAEPFLWKPRKAEDTDSGDESVQSFLERHVGLEPVQYLADPFCAGTAGSDPSSLIMKYAFPGVWELEQKHGSLIVGAFLGGIEAAKSRKKGPKASKPAQGGSYSFLGGMQTLPNTLASKIGTSALRLGTSVNYLDFSAKGSHSGRSWRLGFARDGEKKTRKEEFDAVILTAPLHSWNKIQFSRDGSPTNPVLPPVTYQPMSLLVNAFKAEDIRRALPGFGVLVPSSEQKKHGFQTLGTLFSSFMFGDRAPAGEVLFTTFVGGSRNRELALKPSDELQEVAMKDLRQLVGVTGPPIFTQHICWKKGFPEYGKNHAGFLKALEAVESDFPGFYYAGNHRGGLAVGSAMVAGSNAAASVVEYLKSREAAAAQQN